MPDVTVRNDTPDNLNIAFRFVAPASWTNTLTPGNTWSTHLPSTPFTVEVRIDYDDNRFHEQNSWAIAALTLGNSAAAERLMNHAMQAGARFAQDANGMVITVGNVWILFHNKAYAVRFEENSGYSLWDVDQNVKL